MASKLDLMFTLTNEDISKESIYIHYLNKAELAIKQYCNIEAIDESLNPVVVDLAIYFYKNRDLEGVRQATQGSRSQTLEAGIPTSIKTCLPLPKLRLM